MLVANSAGQSRLWVRSLDSLNATPLAGTDGAAYPFWSPDGTRIGFFAQGKLKTIAAAGGLVVTLCDVVNGRGGTWNRDGVILFTPDAIGGMYRVRGDRRHPVAVTTGSHSTDGSDRFPEFLPDGRRFLFLRTTARDGGLYGGALSDASITRILPEISNAAYVPGQGRDGFLVFRRENTLVAQPFDPDRLQTTGGVVPIAEQVYVAGNTGYGAFTLSQDGTVAYKSGIRGGSRQLVWLDRLGKRLGVVSKPDEISSPALSPDGKMVAFSVGNFTARASDLWLQDLKSGVLSRLTFGPRPNDTPVWSPDSIASPSWFLQVRPLKSKRCACHRVRPLRRRSRRSLLLDWGERLVFGREADRVHQPGREDERRYLAVAGRWRPKGRSVSADAGRPKERADSHLAASGWPTCRMSRDGNEVYVQHVPSNGSKFQISASGGAAPRWSRDGRELFYLEGNKLMTVPVKAGTTFERGQARVLFDDVHFLALSSRPATASGFSRCSGRREVSADRSLTVVTNWPATLKTSK